MQHIASVPSLLPMQLLPLPPPLQTPRSTVVVQQLPTHEEEGARLTCGETGSTNFSGSRGPAAQPLHHRLPGTAHCLQVSIQHRFRALDCGNLVAGAAALLASLFEFRLQLQVESW
jgi:hypothetical protein